METTEATTEWIDKHEAANRLKLNWRTVLQMAKNPDVIKSKRVRDPKTKQLVVMLHAGDVERRCYERDNPETITPVKAIEKKPESAVSMAYPAAAFWQALIDHFDRLAQPAPLPLLYLTLAEAARYTRLPARVLKVLAIEGKVQAIDVGDTRTRWMFGRDGLTHIGVPSKV